MSIWNALHSPYSYEDAFQAKDCTSQVMRSAIQEWFRYYYEREATEESDPCQQLAYTIVRKLTKTVFGEYEAKTASKDTFVQTVLDALDSCKKSAMQLALVGGEAWLKPIFTESGFVFSVISRDHVLVFGRDGLGRPTDIGTTESTVEGNNWYTLLERRSVDAHGYLTIRNQLYCSAMPETLGQPVPLKTLARYADLPNQYTFPKAVGGLGLAWMKTPLENCVDGSRDGVSVYAPAVGLIRNIDRNEALLNGEFERGQSRIIVSADMLRRDRSGKRVLSDKIFTGIDENPEAVGLTIFSPELREQSFLARKQEYLRTAENIIGLKRGLLSEVEATERTATEITSSAGDYNLTIIDFQQMWETTVREAVQICGVLGQLYNVPNAHEAAGDNIAIDWGNGILNDEDKIWADYMGMVSAGMLKPEIALGWRFGMPAESEEDLSAIRAKFMPELDRMAENDI